LQRLLTGSGNHPFLPESNAVSQLLRGYRSAVRMSGDRIERYFGSAEDVQLFYRETIDRLLCNILRGRMGVTERLRKHLRLELKPRKYLILKDPLMLDVAMEALALFKHAHLIVMVRNPLDVLASRKSVWQRQGKIYDINQLIELTRTEVKYLSQIAKSRTESTHLCRYERLCEAPETTLKILGQKLDFNPSTRPNSEMKRASPFYTALTGQAVSTASIDRHKDVLTKRELHLAQDALSAACIAMKGLSCLND
jgi:hypothetical protein